MGTMQRKLTRQKCRSSHDLEDNTEPCAEVPLLSDLSLRTK